MSWSKNVGCGGVGSVEKTVFMLTDNGANSAAKLVDAKKQKNTKTNNDFIG
jgi:hypothetical protein